MADSKTLILIPDCFPFKAFEPYLENEFVYLEKSFDKIFIFSASEVKKPLYTLPEHVAYYNYPPVQDFSSKIKALLSFDISLFKAEKKFVNSTLKQKFDLTKIKIMIMEFYKAKMLCNFIKNVLHNELHNPGNVYVYSYWCDYKAMTVALLKKEFPAVKAISRAHGWDVYFERNTSQYLPLRTFVFNKLDKVYFISQSGKSYTSNKYKDHSKFALSLLGTNLSAEPEFDRKRTPFHIVSCSSLIPLKRVHLLIEAIALLPDFTDIRWTHFGEGVLSDNIKDLAEKKLASRSNIHFEFTGHISNKDVLQFYARENVNLLVNTSSTEGLPMTMMEAMSCGIPVLGTNVGGVSEIVYDNKNGFLLSSNPYPLEISVKILSFIEMDNDLYSRFCVNAFDTWNTKFNAKKNFPEFIKEVLSLN